MTLFEFYLLSSAISLILWIVFVVLYRRFGVWFTLFVEEEEEYPKFLITWFFLSFLPFTGGLSVVLIVGVLCLSYITTFVRVIILGGGVLTMTEFESEVRFKFTEEAIAQMEERRERKERQRREKEREKQIIEMVKYK